LRSQISFEKARVWIRIDLMRIRIRIQHFF
jgi:hypothetical protein